MYFASILTLVTFAISSTIALPASTSPDHIPIPAPGTQPGCGPAGCHNPTGTFGLQRNNHIYHSLCDQHRPSAKYDHRVKACFDTQLKLERYLSAPSPRKLHGFIDGSDTNFVLFAGEIVTLDETLEIHVDKVKGDDKAEKHGCARVKIYHLPKWTLEVDEVWCAGHDAPIQL
ncbi:hypothetical protein PHBOTO_000994 [Pseudozyma hubeiensis]|nr:hypothetical protein PHBOTO_000994 [Pseudozyma hubeiensis]